MVLEAHGNSTLQRFGQARHRVDQWRSRLREAFEFSLPHYDPFGERRSEGGKVGDRVFDSTLVQGIQDLAGDLHTMLLPPFDPWVEFRVPVEVQALLTQDVDQMPEEVRLLRAQLQQQQALFFAYVQRSNFHSEINDAMLNLAVSTGAILVHEGEVDAPLRFEAVPMGQFVPEEGPSGTIETNYRDWEVMKRNLLRQWPQAKWSGDVASAGETDAIHIVEATIFQPETREYVYQVVEADSGHTAVNEKLESSPWIVFRWLKAPREILGRGPVLQALADAKSLNKAMELTLRNAALAVAGAYQAEHDGVLNPRTITIQPNIIIPHAPGSKGIRPLERSGDFTLADALIQRLSASVKNALVRPLLPPVEGAVRSPTEIATRFEEAERRITPPFLRMYSELLVPLVKRIQHILISKNLMTPVEFDGQEIEMQPVSPLTRVRAQARMVQAHAMIGQLMQLDPGAMQTAVKIDDFNYWALSQVVPDKLLYAPSEAAARRAQAVQTAQLAEDAKTANQVAQAAATAGLVGGDNGQ